MTPVLPILGDLARHDVRVSVQGDKLRVDAPRGVLTPDLVDRLRAHKADLLIALRDDIGPDDLPSDWRIEWEERAAIMEYDGGLTREHAEAEALAHIQRQMREDGDAI